MNCQCTDLFNEQDLSLNFSFFVYAQIYSVELNSIKEGHFSTFSEIIVFESSEVSFNDVITVHFLMFHYSDIL